MSGRARPVSPTVIPKKQQATHEQFVAAMANIEQLVPRREFDDLLDATVSDVRRTLLTSRGAVPRYAWSGGKDSMALQLVMERAAVRECVLGMTDLEYPEFLRWVTQHMPDGLTVINTGLDLEWLERHPQMLFPRDADTASRWFALIQHRAQDRYVRAERATILILGRRAADGNFMGRDGSGLYQKPDGCWRYSPLQHWRHEDVLAACHYYGYPLAPNYGWPRGYRVGTGAWPARQWTRSPEHGWDEIWQIDPDIVRAATIARIPGAFACELRHV